MFAPEKFEYLLEAGCQKVSTRPTVRPAAIDSAGQPRSVTPPDSAGASGACREYSHKWMTPGSADSPSREREPTTGGRRARARIAGIPNGRVALVATAMGAGPARQMRGTLFLLRAGS